MNENDLDRVILPHDDEDIYQKTMEFEKEFNQHLSNQSTGKATKIRNRIRLEKEAKRVGLKVKPDSGLNFRL